MTELVIRPSAELPAAIEDLSRFVLVGREKLNSVRAEIRAIDKLGLADAVREQKLREGQIISEALLDAEVRLGELMRSIPKTSGGNHGNQYTSGKIDSGVVFGKTDKETEDRPSPNYESNSDDEPRITETIKTKAEIIREAGFTMKQAERFQQLAMHPDLVEQAKAEARENEDIVSRSLVLSKIKEQKRQELAEKRERERQENEEKVSKLHQPLNAMGLFETIVIDPAWDWGDEGDVNQFGRAKPDYHTMSIDEIEALPVAQISAPNSHIYLWITNRSLPKGFRLLEAWGFRYITCLTWLKPSIGMGNYFRGSTEQILFGVKGSQGLKRHDVGTYFEAPRGPRHSEKPDKFYELVESCSYAPYIDIFGRKERTGWVVWGENT